MTNSIAARLQRDWLEACEQMGIPAVTTDTAARVLAVLYVFGGEHEAVTLNVKFTQEVQYIQRRFRIEGGSVPDAHFAHTLRHYVSQLEKHDQPPQWAVNLYRDRYGISIK